jgi:hypothetical protein
MTFDYPGACLNGKEPEKGISGGAVFLIMYVNSTPNCLYKIINSIFSLLSIFCGLCLFHWWYKLQRIY